jgi:predicted lipid carrier protein YhbT
VHHGKLRAVWKTPIRRATREAETMTLPDRLFRLATLPLGWVPGGVHSRGLALVLNRVLAEPLAGQELDFLHGKVIALAVTDLGIEYRLTCGSRGFAAADGRRDANVRFSGDSYAFLLLATQREDADALFFRRMLRIEGETATGIHLKNFIDALGEPPLPAPLRSALERMLSFYERHHPQAANG